MPDPVYVVTDGIIFEIRQEPDSMEVILDGSRVSWTINLEYNRWVVHDHEGKWRAAHLDPVLALNAGIELMTKEFG